MLLVCSYRLCPRGRDKWPMEDFGEFVGFFK